MLPMTASRKAGALAIFFSTFSGWAIYLSTLSGFSSFTQSAPPAILTIMAAAPVPIMKSRTPRLSIICNALRAASAIPLQHRVTMPPTTCWNRATLPPPSGAKYSAISLPALRYCSVLMTEANLNKSPLPSCGDAIDENMFQPEPSLIFSLTYLLSHPTTGLSALE